ncbi:MAG TPA: FG-GAP-like repeat-containing protein, partial [Rhizomicrobium sp.]|nr:FG-GAP-like repeat-containing protein [Rhizomicrobium sp.]
MMPTLALAYSSQLGDGYEGLGWSLTGLASITRCPRTVKIDSVHGGVNYDSNDHFCLGGEELMAISGTYGADGTEYRLLSDNFTKIISHGTAGSGPGYFTAQLRNGATLEFGNTTDSKFKALKADGSGVSSSVAIWGEDKITDIRGNYLTITYTNDTTNSQLYPSRIDYTGNATASLSTYNSVQFTYMDRTYDVTPQYQAGTYTEVTKLLTHVKTYNGSTVVTDYQLAYNYASSGASHNELSMVKQCDASGTTCLAPTSFTWQGSRDAPSLNSGVDVDSISHGVTVLPGDFLGSSANAIDGLTDLVTVDQSGCPTGGHVWAGSPSGTFARSGIDGSYNYYLSGSSTMYTASGDFCFYGGDGQVGDFNGDGVSDIQLNENYYIYDSDDHSWIPNPYSNVLLNDKAGSLTQTSSARAWPAEMTLGDFNGDGMTDGLGYFSNGDGTFTADSTHSAMLTGATRILTGDFDGDGCTDILTQGTTNGIGYYCNPAVSTATVPDFTGSTIYVGDFNGDGIADILAVSSTSASLYFGTGTGLTAAVSFSYSGTPSLSNWHNYSIRTGDFNGDGKTDIMLVSHASGTAHAIALSTGSGFVPLTTISNSDTTAVATIADWNNDGADDIWLQNTSATHDKEYTFAFTPELITGVDEGLGSTSTPDAIAVTYDRLNENGTFYTKGTGASSGYADLDGAFYVVKELDTPNAAGGTYAHTYAYAGALKDMTAPPVAGPRSDLLSAGFIGFASVAVSDSHLGTVLTSSYHTDIPYIGLPSSQSVKLGTQSLMELDYTYSSVSTGGGANALQLTETVLTRHDVTATAYPTVTTDYTYDSYNNPLTVTTSVSDGSSDTVTNTYNNDTTNWILGQLATRSDERVVGTSDITRHYSFTYGTSGAGTLGLLTEFDQEHGTTSLELDATFTYDTFGNRLTTYLDGTGVTGRTADTSTYDSLGRFLATSTDAQSLETSVSRNADFGTPASVTDPDTLTTGATYDSFGRITGVTNKNGTKASIGYVYCSGVNGGSASCPTHGAVAVTATPLETDGSTQNGPETIRYYDALGREIAADMQGFDGSWIRQETQYDAYLNVSQTSRPYFLSSGTPQWTVYSYIYTGTSPDPFGRVWKITGADSSTTTYAYDALATTMTDDNGHATKTTLNAEGQIASVYDALSHTTSYVYDAFGNKTKSTDPAGNISTATFDTRGRETAFSDPDRGSWSFTYDVLSELTGYTDAKSQSFTFTYDLDGRPKRRTEPDLTSLLLFDSGGSGGSAYGQGHPWRDCNASTCSSSTYQRTFTYNSLGQIQSVAINKIDTSTYTYSLTYDSASGRLSTLTYPSGLVLKYDYNSYGYLSDIKNNSTSAVIWTANARDAELHLTEATSGPSTKPLVAHADFDAETGRVENIRASNDGTDDGSVTDLSYTWDGVGNLAERDDTVNGTAEVFSYDALDRQTQSPINGGSTRATAYDAAGNMTKHYAVCTTASCMTYGSGAGPHALTGITGTYNGVTNPTLTYDSNGNMTAGVGESYAWTSYNMVSSITKGTSKIGFTYGPEHNRLKQCIGDVCSGSPTTTLLYLNDPITGSGSEKSTSGTT